MKVNHNTAAAIAPASVPDARPAPPSPPAKRPPSARRRARPHGPLVAAATILAVGLAGGTAYATLGRDNDGAGPVSEPASPTTAPTTASMKPTLQSTPKASPTAASSVRPSAAAAPEADDWQRLPHPWLNCDDIGLGAEVVDVQMRTVDGEALTFVTWQCVVSTGSAPETTAVYAGRSTDAPRAGVIFTEDDDANGTRLSISGRTITATARTHLPTDSNAEPTGRLSQKYTYSGRRLSTAAPALSACERSLEPVVAAYLRGAYGPVAAVGEASTTSQTRALGKLNGNRYDLLATAFDYTYQQGASDLRELRANVKDVCKNGLP